MNLIEKKTNEQAWAARKKGDFKEVQRLGAVYGATDESIRDFLTGDAFFFEKKKDEVDIVVPFYKSVEEKLKSETEALLKNAEKKELIEGQLKVITDFILSDETLRAQAFLDYKELSRMYEYLTSHAREYALNGVACIQDDTVFGWVREYFALDDEKEVTAERRAAALQKKRQEQEKKKTSKKKGGKNAKEKPADTKTEDDKAGEPEADKPDVSPV